MNHTERRRYADAMARAAAAYMTDSDAQELANNLACSEPENVTVEAAFSAIAMRMREFDVECSSPHWCAIDIRDAAHQFKARKSA